MKLLHLAITGGFAKMTAATISAYVQVILLLIVLILIGDINLSNWVIF